MQLSQQVTNKEISKRLEELGIKQESLFYFKKQWYDPNPPTRETAIRWVLRCSYQEISGQSVNVDETISAFTCSELGEMLPSKIKNDTLHFAKCGYGEAIQWQVFYTDDNTHEPKQTICALTLADAMGKMLVYFYENGLIKNV